MSLGAATHWHRPARSTAAIEEHWGGPSNLQDNSYAKHGKDVLRADLINRSTRKRDDDRNQQSLNGPEIPAYSEFRPIMIRLSRVRQVVDFESMVICSPRDYATPLAPKRKSQESPKAG